MGRHAERADQSCARRRRSIAAGTRDADDDGGTRGSFMRWSDSGTLPRDARTIRRPRVPEEIRRLGRVHHVAVVVADLDAALGFWRDTLGLELDVVDGDARPTGSGSRSCRSASRRSSSSSRPTTRPASPASWRSKGEGFHHVCFEVANLAETLLRLEIDGVELIDTAPRKGAEGPVAFLHPRSCHGVLVELIEAPGGPAWSASVTDLAPSAAVRRPPTEA